MKRLTVPHFDDLTLEEFIKFAKDHPEALKYLPDERDLLNLQRQYIIDIIYTVIGQPFKEWVDERILIRNNKLKVTRNLDIAMDSRIVEIFLKSAHISSR